MVGNGGVQYQLVFSLLQSYLADEVKPNNDDDYFCHAALRTFIVEKDNNKSVQDKNRHQTHT